ncbi:TadE/TadG family type IV pilus assembly protein [Motilimonas cestriensis]|uniref:TadE/TadG family type IV pilus assembly protein n=1 Tax=Motilimonas cestriensis TaxID=2742685 RepID=UPI003DA5399C
MSQTNSKKEQQGQAMFESIIVLLLACILVLIVVEIAFFYRAKSTLNTATFEAARSGSVSNASADALHRGFIRGILPLHIRGDASTTGLVKANLRAETYRATGMYTIQIISPDRRVFNAFKTQVYDLKSDSFIDAIPNDNLNYRSNVTKTVQQRINGRNENVEINIQDANLLKIKTRYCHELLVPVMRQLLKFELFGTSALATHCNTLGGAFSGKTYMVIESSAVVRMQSPIFERNLN